MRSRHRDRTFVGPVLVAGQVLAPLVAWLIFASAAKRDNGLALAGMAYLAITFVACLVAERAERTHELRERSARDGAKDGAGTRGGPEASGAAVSASLLCWYGDDRCTGTSEWITGQQGPSILLCQFHASQRRDRAATAPRAT